MTGDRPRSPRDVDQTLESAGGLQSRHSQLGEQTPLLDQGRHPATAEGYIAAFRNFIKNYIISCNCLRATTSDSSHPAPPTVFPQPEGLIDSQSNIGITESAHIAPTEGRADLEPSTTTATGIEFNPEQDQPRQHEGDRTRAEVQFKETLNAIGKCYNFYNEFAKFIKKVEGLTAQLQSQVRLEEWQKLAREAKVFPNFRGSQIKRSDLVDKLSSLLDRDMEQLNDSIPPDSKESFKKALRMLAYIKSDKRHAFSVPLEKAQQIESFCRDTFTQRSQELRERYHIGVYPENAPPSWAKEFGGSERFVQIKMSSYERLGLSRDASKEDIQRALVWDSDHTCYVNVADNVIIVTDTYRSEDAHTGTYRSEDAREELPSEARYNYPKTLPSSEVLFYMYQAADQHFREKNSSFIPRNNEITVIRHNIRNEKTKEVLYKLNISQEEEKKIYHRYKESGIFQELANTPNGRPFFFALAQHPEQFGRLEVDRIEVRNNYAGYHMIQHASLNDNYPQEA